MSRSTKPWTLIVGLHPDTYYFVKVMAFNGAGAGPESERILGVCSPFSYYYYHRTVDTLIYKNELRVVAS